MSQETKETLLRRRQKQLIKPLCGGVVSLLFGLKDLGATPDECEGKSQTELEKMYIKGAGIDEIIDASEYVQSLDKAQGGADFNFNYGNTLAAVRHERGLDLLSQAQSLKTKAQREILAKGLSKHALEDVYESKGLRESLDTFGGKTIESLQIFDYVMDHEIVK